MGKILKATPDQRDTAGNGLRGLDSEALGHLFVEESFAGVVGLDPFAVDDELGDGALAGALDDFVGGAGGGFNIDSLKGICAW